VIGEWRIAKDFGRKRQRNNRDTVLEIAGRDWGEQTGTSVRITVVPATFERETPESKSEYLTLDHLLGLKMFLRGIISLFQRKANYPENQCSFSCIRKSIVAFHWQNSYYWLVHCWGGLLLNKICEHNNLRINFNILSSFFSTMRMLFLISMLASLNVYFYI
jgi:hypothetical protein